MSMSNTILLRNNLRFIAKIMRGRARLIDGSEPPVGLKSQYVEVWMGFPQLE